MLNIVSKKNVIQFLIAMLIILAVCLITNLLVCKTNQVFAATTPKYKVAFSYTYTFSDTKSQDLSVNESGKDVYTVSFISGSNNQKSTMTVNLYGSNASGTGTFSENGFINSSDVTISALTTNVKVNIKIVNSKTNSFVYSGKEQIKASNLFDGEYTVTISSSNGWTIGSSRSAKYSFVATFNFKVDSTAPEIIGASKINSEILSNDILMITANDSASGLKKLYVKSPEQKTFYNAGLDHYIINKGSINGLYTFYAEDVAGNKSEYYYVTFDDTPPELTCLGAELNSVSDNVFTISALDKFTDAMLYYKTSYASDWVACGKDFTVEDVSYENTYYFYAVDSLGNRTENVWIRVSNTVFGKFIKSDTDNSVYFTWDNPNWTAILDGEIYVKNTIISAEGNHTITLSSHNNSVVYNYTIEHYYEEEVHLNTCEEAGYTKYLCKQCGHSYVANYTEKLGHNYVITSIPPTCVNDGYTKYSCTRCGDSYNDNYIKSIGHNYDIKHVPSTCTDYGKTVFTCQVCGSGYYEIDGMYPTGHNYNNEVIIAPTCTVDGLRRSICESCGHTFDTKITANGHNYNITESTSANGKTTRTYTCTVCNHSYKQELGDQYEEVTNYVEYLFEQYSPYMWWILLVAAGVWSIVMGVFFAIAQKNEDKEKSKKMIINYVIGLVVIAIIIVACPFLIRGIAALVT